MEQPLRTLFALDLWVGSTVRFRPFIFIMVFAAGALFIFAEALILGPAAGILGISAPPNAPLQWLAASLLAALVSFKWERAGA